MPIYQTTSYQFQSAEHAANLFALKELGNIYTRIMNPTTDVLEKRVAALEGGVAALALASGQAASAFALQNLARAGDNVVSSTDLYGGTWNLFANTFKDQGIEVRFVDPVDPENFRKATDARTRVYYAETLPNPKLIAFPIVEVAAIGRSFGIPCRHGQYGRPDPDPSLRSWRGDHRLLVDQVPRRPRQLDRRHPGRRRQFPLGGTQGAPAGAQHARPELSRSGVDGGGEAARADRLYHQGAHHPPARPGLMHVAVQRVPDPARNRNAASADRAPLLEHGGVAAWLGKRPEVTNVIHPSFQKGEAKRRAEKYLKGGQAALSASSSGAARRRGASSSTP